jgi:hypothetical protein
MSDDYDDPMAMGIDADGQPIHHYGGETIGAVGGLHGTSFEDVEARAHSMAPDGTPVPDVHIPPEHHAPRLDGVWGIIEDKYEEFMHPDATKGERDPATDAATTQQDTSHDQHQGTEPTVYHAPERKF